MLTRTNMIQKLREGNCTVTFTKANGDIREMVCTLNSNAIPETDMPKNPSAEYTEDVIKVYDIVAAGWRSFRVDSVQIFDSRTAAEIQCAILLNTSV